MELKWQATEVKVDGMQAATLIDPKAMGLLTREFPTIRVAGISLVYEGEPEDVDLHGKPKQYSIVIGHANPDDQKKSVLLVDCSKGDAVPKVLKVLEGLAGHEAGGGHGAK